MSLEDYQEIYQMDSLNESYQLISYLKYLRDKEHIPEEEILKCLPSPEIIHQDQEHFIRLARLSHCYMGFGFPVSYSMTEELIKKKDLSRYGERPRYYVSKMNQFVDAEFTTEEFLEGVKKTQKVYQKNSR